MGQQCGLPAARATKQEVLGAGVWDQFTLVLRAEWLARRGAVVKNGGSAAGPTSLSALPTFPKLLHQPKFEAHLIRS
jgi:hypothetical protein